MAEPNITVTDIGVGPLPGDAQGATLLITLSSGASIPVFLAPDQAVELAKQIFNIMNPRFPSGRLPNVA